MRWVARRVTQIPKDIRDEYLRDMRKIYTPQAYSLFHNNCNNFTNDFSTFLTGSGIPVSSCTFWDYAPAWFKSTTLYVCERFQH